MYLTLGFLCEVEVKCKVLDVASTLQTVSRIPRWFVNLLLLLCRRFYQVLVSANARRPDGSVGMALVLRALTDCRWWFESLLVHSGVSSATRRKATGADQKKWQQRLLALCGVFTLYTMSLVTSGSLVWPY